MDRNEFSVLIVDDEPEARSLLKSLLSEIKNVRVIGEADTAEKALYYLVEHYPQLVFLDLSMPGKSGIEFIQLLQNRNVDVSIVVVSAYKKYAVEALRNGVYDFILKPVDLNYSLSLDNYLSKLS
jgi:YesN/AraC family two-component response regulator